MNNHFPTTTRLYIDAVCDLFHYGHVELFRQARSLFENPYLIVGLNHEDVIDYKHKPILTLEERQRVVESCRYVDEVITPGPLPVTKAFMLKHEIDYLVHGDDITKVNRQKWYGQVIEMGRYKQVPYTLGISSTEIRQRILNQELSIPQSFRVKSARETSGRDYR